MKESVEPRTFLGPETKLLARPKAESEYTTKVKDVSAAQVVLSLVLSERISCSLFNVSKLHFHSSLILTLIALFRSDDY